MSSDEALTQSILKQVEYYFSPQNLAHDHYLISKMNSQMWVQLEVVAGFKMLRNLTTDLDLLKNALQDSSKIQLLEQDGQVLIRPAAVSAARVTIILRDMDKELPAEEVTAIFPHKDKILKVHPDIGNTWFVTFGDEDDCKEAYEAISEAEFRGNPIKARIKSENLLKSFLPAGAAGTPPGAPGAPQHPVFVPPPMPYFGFPGHMPMPHPGMMMGPMGRPFPGGPPFGQVRPGPPYPGPMPGAPMNNHMPGAERDAAGYGRGTPKAQGKQATKAPKEGKAGKSQAAPKTSSKRGSHNGPKVVTPPKLGPQDFPPLPSSSQPTAGYEGAFKKYSKLEIIGILSVLQNEDVPVPEDIPKGSLALAKEPIKVIELTRNIKEEVDEKGDGEKFSFANAARQGKTFAEAAITAKDIKPPEMAKTRRNSSKKGPSPAEGEGNSKKAGGRKSTRSSRNSRNSPAAEKKEKKKSGKEEAKAEASEALAAPAEAAPATEAAAPATE